MPSGPSGYGSLTFPAGAGSATITITSLEDPDSPEYVSIGVASSSGAGYRVGGDSEATVTLQDVTTVPVNLASAVDPATPDESLTISATLPANPALAANASEGPSTFYDGTSELGSQTLANANALGNALQFDGSTNYVNLGSTQNSTLDFTMTSPFSVSFWMNSSNTSRNRRK